MTQPDKPEQTADGIRMPFLGHLEELRWCIIRSLIALGAGFGIAMFFIRDLVKLIELPLVRAGIQAGDSSLQLRTISVGESFSMLIMVAGGAGLLLAIPYIFYEIWRFVSPGLMPSEKRAVGPLILFGTLFFYGGVAFCHLLVIPPALTYFLQLNQYLGLVTEWRAKDYLSFTMTMLISAGILSELPVLTVVLARFGILSAAFMIHYWRHAVVILLVLAAAITPSTDPLSMLVLAVPLIALYALSIFLAKAFYVQR